MVSAAPSAPSDGTVVFTATDDHDSIATFACDSGFTLSGDATLTCDATTSNSPWGTATNPPTCTVNSCSAAPSAPSDGTVVFSATDDHDSIATFACDSGFTLSGDATVTCDATTSNS